MSLTQDQQDYLDDSYDRKKDDEMIEQAEQDTGPEFNNGFLTAIALFLEHKNFHLVNTLTCQSDSRLYGAADHLMEMHIPEFLEEKLKNRIVDARNKVMENRLGHLSFDDTFKITNEIFEEFENIMIEIDKKFFVQKVVVKYR